MFLTLGAGMIVCFMYNLMDIHTHCKLIHDTLPLVCTFIISYYFILDKTTIVRHMCLHARTFLHVNNKKDYFKTVLIHLTLPRLNSVFSAIYYMTF